MHRELLLARGVQKSIGDANSAEQGVDTIDLMDTNNGFSLNETSGWQPRITGLKSGVWADSAVAVGRQLVAGEDGNVTETIRLVIATGDMGAMHEQVARLNRFIANCREMWTTFHQVEPVFLWWWANCSPDRQYALVYNIDITVEYPDAGEEATADVTLTIEREPYWRALPPGANPKLWRYYVNNAMQSFDYLDAYLWSGTDHLIVETIYNSHSWSSNNVVGTKNYIDIPAASIPGDAPALIEFSIDNVPDESSCDPGVIEGLVYTDVYVSRVSKPLRPRRRATPGGVVAAGTPIFNILNGNDGTLGGGVANVNDTCGVLSTGSATRQKTRISTFSAGTPRITWTTGQSQRFDFLKWRGRYAVYVRMTLNGVVGDGVTVWFGVGYDTSNTSDLIVSTPVSPVDAGSDTIELRYLGEVTFPPMGRIPVTPDGQGAAATLLANGDFRLYANRASGTATLDIYDVVFMPIDEQMVHLHIDESLIFAGGFRWIYDNTSYMTHGEQYAIGMTGSIETSGLDYYEPDGQVECRGQDLTLVPGVDNRLYFMVNKTYVNGTSIHSSPPSQYDVRLNITPRWRGARDQ